MNLEGILFNFFFCWSFVNWLSRLNICENLKCYLFHFNMQSLEGISDIRDESDRSGMRVVIEVGNPYSVIL